ncbi:MAG: N(4)-(beta-N-acetylglucosaminyl)-L-asparaginase [Sphingobacteriales bacterium]|nr:N(4)-(beta-N-acetylglucosaminyl)-L-asparaginase [Sphingobacteriales bacterium]
MSNRRTFLKNSFLLAALGAVGIPFSSKGEIFPVNLSTLKKGKNKKNMFPLVISTWKHGLAANEEAWKVLINKGSALDAVEMGVRVSEADPEVTSVGYGGLPDRDGHVTLDACIMDHLGNCGSVAFLEHIMHPVSVARAVMEKTNHIMLVGKGALDFALSQGFKKENLLTPEAKLRWEEWLKSENYHPEPVPSEKNHDTIGMLAIDLDGNICGACTTSGLAWKYHGRVGDSPIIGAGLYVDNEVGGACATGRGEAVIKMAGSHLIVELMRQGKSPQEACREAIERIVRKQKDFESFQVGFLAVNKHGETGAFSISEGFEFALYHDNQNKLYPSDYYLKNK